MHTLMFHLAYKAHYILFKNPIYGSINFDIKMISEEPFRNSSS